MKSREVSKKVGLVLAKVGLDQGGYLHVVIKILYVKVIGVQKYYWVECWF